MIEYRKAKPEEEPAILDFINMVFSMSHRPHQFATLIEKVYGRPGFSRFHTVAVRDGSIRATAALLPMTLHPTPETSLHIGYVGSVSVHPSDRREGHMKEVMRFLLRDAQEQGLDLLMLGGQRQRYRFNGFERGCATMEFEVNPSNVRHDLRDVEVSGFSLRRAEKEDIALWKAISALSRKRRFTVDRPIDDLSTILTTWYEEVWVLTGPEQQVFGYFVLCRGRICEFAFDTPLHFKAALKLWVADHEAVPVSVPFYDRENADLLRAFAEQCILKNAHMVNVFRWQKVLQTLLSVKHAASPLPEGRMVFSIDGETLAVEVSGNTVSVLETAELPQRILSKTEAVTLFFSATAMAMETSPLLKSWLPLPLSLSDPDCF